MSEDTTEGLRERYAEAMEDYDNWDHLIDKVVAVHDEEVERLRAELAEAKREANGLRRENTRLREANTQHSLNAEADVCTGCMQREQQRDKWAETSRQNGIKAEQNKQAFYREQDRARQVEAERDALKAKVTEYENALNWQTSCLACSKVLDSSIAEHERAIEEHDRADRAEAAIRVITSDWKRRARAAAARVNEAKNGVEEVRWNAWRTAYECLATELLAALDAPETPEES